MGKIQECADTIKRIMMYSDPQKQIQNECNLNKVLDTMLIFLDADDLHEILVKKVIPSLYKQTLDRWENYLEWKIKMLE